MTLHTAIIAALAIVLIAAFWRLLRYRRTVRAITQAILTRQPLPLEGRDTDYTRRSAAGDSRRDLNRLARETNDLIVETRRLQRLRSSQLAQLETTLGNLQEAVLIIDPQNNIRLANKALQSMFPRAATALNQRFERILHSADFIQYVESVRQNDARPQQQIQFLETTPPAATGREPQSQKAPAAVWLEVTGALIPPPDGAGNGSGPSEGPWMLFVLHDITRQRNLESIRKEFVANVSHELRTPLSIIKGSAETLVDAHHEMPVADRDRFLLKIQQHAERLNSLLEDLLTLSRLESPNPGLHLEATSFPRLVNGIMDDYRARQSAAEHPVTATLDPAIAEVRIDPLKVTQVFENLLNNALRHTPPGTQIVLSARMLPVAQALAPTSYAESVASVIEVRVSDNGPGIPEADLPHIFERFYRVDKGRSRTKGGTGLGLSIMKHIVQLHGGQVRVESQPGQGTTFIFTLPV